ncbi:Polynucleotide 3'-phosphatase ZDP-like protein [Drosera capensis]
MLTTIAAIIFPSPNPNLMSRLIAEYAKSSRSTCKVCSDPIVTKSLRLGVLTRDARGFDLTKWHHLGCFSKVKLKGKGIGNAEAVTGFESLKGDDKEALREVMDQWGKASDEAAKTKEDGESLKKKRDTKKEKVAETVEDGEDRTETSPKRAKLPSDVKVELALSASDITDNYKGATLMLGWKAFQTIIFLEKDEGLQDSSKISAFDFDGCLANTSVKRIGADAWSLIYPSIPEKLQRLYNYGYKLVIFTNESNIERWKNKRQVAVYSKLGRLDKFIKCVKAPIQHVDLTKVAKKILSGKPKPGMWHIMEKHFSSGIKIDIDKSFHVGDAAGRANDHSDADIKFAEAIGLKFYAPEDYFWA